MRDRLPAHHQNRRHTTSRPNNEVATAHDIKPALTPEDWKRISRDGERLKIRFPGPPGTDSALEDVYLVCVEARVAAQGIAVANSALPDDSPYKLTHADLKTLRDRDNYLGGGTDLGKLAAKLKALLPAE